VSLAHDLEDTLRDLGTPERAEQEKRYLKSALEHFGTTVPLIRRTVRELLRESPDLTRVELLRAVATLWARPVHECRAAAVELLVDRGDLLEADDLAVVERLLRTARTWALVDPLAARVAGGLVERFPELAPTLDRWSSDDDFWLRRASMLALLLPLRRGDGDFERFGRNADAMLDDREFFIRKSIGWILREAGRRAPDRVTAWLLPRASRASGLTFREGTRGLPAAQRAKLERARAKGA
jgi:3-methyladenine DNA glycosylase AlkD